MNLRIDSPGKSSAFVDIHICLPVFVFRLSQRGMFAAPVGIVNKREGIQNPTLITAKAGQAYPQKILLMNWLFEKMNPLVVPVTGVKFKSAFLYVQ